ncbi:MULTISPECIES: AzlC family ABC transporter permease [Arthrobacter]|uniref:Branched-chain amino acid ABC transporter permease n=1 Tax=Arthrobacter terricola TaxID=2547396 RepID=A0A4R5KEU0_9MICC|nr:MULTISPECIES: AzlC family ABC transporter permease [Arthrobacter]MBT8161791.1 AzlC family ABC transporter permease [Arthrobacter sp. GN70]TDF92650.1 branched-chain amino acid ABC transporter permease [Arthrobacter terricola]
MEDVNHTAIVSAPPTHPIKAGIKDSFAAGLGMFPLGIAFGLLVVQSGLPWWVAPALSISGFAGSLELLLIGMMTAMTPLATVALTTLLVNFRHVFYSFTFPLHVVKSPLAKTYSMYALIDEAYAVTAASKGNWNSQRLISMQVAFQAYWVGGGLTGLAVAAVLPIRIEGLEFALCALFVTLTLDAVKSRKELPSLVLGAASYTAAVLFMPNAALFAGLVMFVFLLVARHFFFGRKTASTPTGEDHA